MPYVRNNQTVTQPADGGVMKKALVAVVLLVVLLGLIAAGYAYFGNSSGGTGPVARVNGIEISRTNYNNSVRTLAGSAATQGFNLNDPGVQTQIQAQALTSLINAELLLQAALAGGVIATDAEVQTEYDAIVASLGGEGELEAQLAANSITEADLRSDIRDQLTIRAYVAGAVGAGDTTATDAEVSEVYNQLVSLGYELPELGSIQPAIEGRLQLEKEQGLLYSLIDSLRAGAEIEILI